MHLLGVKCYIKCDTKKKQDPISPQNPVPLGPKTISLTETTFLDNYSGLLIINHENMFITVFNYI